MIPYRQFGGRPWPKLRKRPPVKRVQNPQQNQQQERSRRRRRPQLLLQQPSLPPRHLLSPLQNQKQRRQAMQSPNQKQAPKPKQVMPRKHLLLPSRLQEAFARQSPRVSLASLLWLAASREQLPEQSVQRPRPRKSLQPNQQPQPSRKLLQSHLPQKNQLQKKLRNSQFFRMRPEPFGFRRIFAIRTGTSPPPRSSRPNCKVGLPGRLSFLVRPLFRFIAGTLPHSCRYLN